MNNKYVISMCPGGMCNRLKCLITCMRISEIYNRKILLYWPENAALGCKFTDLFYSDKNIRLVKKEFLKKLTKNNTTYYDDKDNLIKNTKKDYLILDTWRFGILEKEEMPVAWNPKNRPAINNQSIDHEYKKIPLGIKNSIINNIRKLKIKNEIRKRISHIKNIQNLLGVHIRRGDFKSGKDKVYLGSPLNIFIQKISKEINSNNYAGIYLVTDDKEVENTIKEKFQKVYFYDKGNIDRSSKKTVVDFLIDFENLSKTKKILGSYDSTYSELAWWWNFSEKKEIEIVRDEEAIMKILLKRNKIEKSLINKLKRIVIRLTRKKTYNFTDNYYD